MKSIFDMVWERIEHARSNRQNYMLSWVMLKSSNFTEEQLTSLAKEFPSVWVIGYHEEPITLGDLAFIRGWSSLDIV